MKSLPMQNIELLLPLTMVAMKPLYSMLDEDDCGGGTSNGNGVDYSGYDYVVKIKIMVR